jgi:PAS domain S-box-containing protein
LSKREGAALEPQTFPRGGGQMGRLIRAHDWSGGALGPVTTWPPPLRTATEVLLNAPIAMVLLWGPDGVMIYNDAYAVFAGRRHPALLGSKVLEGWDEAAEFNARVLAEGLAGRTLSFKDQQLTLDRHGVAEDVWMDLNYGPVFDERGAAAGVLATVVETTARVRAEEALRAERRAALEANRRLTSESAFLKELFEQAPGFMAITSGPGHVVTLANQAYRRLVGDRDLLGRPIAQALPELAQQGFIKALDRAYATAEPFIGQGVRMELHRAAGRGAEERLLDFIFQPIMAAAGKTDGIFIQGQDVTERNRSEQHLRLVVNELNHRVKNTLAMMQAIASQTFRNIDDLPEAQAKFAARIMTLAKANDLLTREGWEGASLRDVINLAAQAHAGPDQTRVSVEGPVVKLTPKTAMSLSMGVHELATNATKYGALSVPAGRIHVRWTLAKSAERDRLRLEWREFGGPTVAAPKRRGFGTRLIDRGLAAELEGSVELLFEPEGVVCRIDALLGPDREAT